MKLLINAESLVPPLTGIGNYTLNLLANFRRYPSIERLECFAGGRFREVDEVLDGVSISTDARGGGAAVAGGGLRRLLRKFGASYALREAVYSSRFITNSKRLHDYIYHEPSFILKPHSGVSIATIHDLSFVYYPEFHPAARGRWLCRQLPKTLTRADFLITDSERVRQELVRDFAVPESRVRSISLGAAERFQPVPPDQAAVTLGRYGLRYGQYVLFLGTIEPRKGVDILLEAWRGLSGELRAHFSLVLAGAIGWHAGDLLAQVEEMRDQYAVRHLDYIPAEDLPALYSGASVFVFPSVYEGFGLPVLEAMKCRVPVICTAETAMADFAGDAVLSFSRGQPEQLAWRIEQLLGDEEACRRHAEAGWVRGQAFSWQNCARETLGVYREFAG